MTRTDMAYRKVAAESDSGLGLLIALYDTLAGNLREAASAQRSNDIEGRCREMAHAFMVIGYLESGLKESPGGELTQQLVAFYAVLRKRLMEAQAKQSAELLEEEMARVLRLRANWQQVELSRDRNEAVQAPSSPASRSYGTTDRRGEVAGWSA